jgi:hypothetical protein
MKVTNINEGALPTSINGPQLAGARIIRTYEYRSKRSCQQNTINAIFTIPSTNDEIV